MATELHGMPINSGDASESDQAIWNRLIPVYTAAEFVSTAFDHGITMASAMVDSYMRQMANELDTAITAHERGALIRIANGADALTVVFAESKSRY